MFPGVDGKIILTL